MSALAHLAAVALAVAPAPTAPVDPNPATTQQLESRLQQAVDAGTPGLSAAIGNSSGVIWTGVAGFADVSATRPVDEAHLFGIGSITKIFIATVILQLVEEGRLRLDDTPAALLGRDAVRGIANSGRATVADLLAHKSGIASWEDDPRWIRAGRGAATNPAHIWGKTEALDYIRNAPALATPGEVFSYSNSGYTLLGLIIEKATGHSAAAEIRRRILAPLGLNDTYLEGFEPGHPDRLPRRYQYLTPQYRETAGVAPGFTEVRPGLLDVGASNLSVEWTAGGMVSSPRDLVLFARALRDGKLISPAHLAFMRQWTPGFSRMEVGHGLFRIKSGDVALIGHTGGVLGFTAVLWWSQSSDTIVAVLANGSGMHAGKTPPKATTLGLSPDFVALAHQFAAQRTRSSAEPSATITYPGN